MDRSMQPDPAVWRRSTRCAHGDCVEVLLDNSRVSMRDSKSIATGTIEFTANEWTGFVAAIRAGEFDLA